MTLDLFGPYDFLESQLRPAALEPPRDQRMSQSPEDRSGQARRGRAAPWALDALDTFPTRPLGHVHPVGAGKPDVSSEGSGSAPAPAAATARRWAAETRRRKKEFVENLQVSVQTLTRENEMMAARLRDMDERNHERAQRVDTVARILTLRVSETDQGADDPAFWGELAEPDRAPPAAHALCGFTAEEAVGKTLAILQGPDTEKGEVADLVRCEDGHATSALLTNYTKEGDKFQNFLRAKGSGFGKSTYAMSDPLGWGTWMATYLPTQPLDGFPVNSTDQCVEWAKLCIDDGHLENCESVSSSTFQMHAVGAYDRDSGDLSMADAETKVYGSALGDFSKFDVYMENNVGLLTQDLDAYVAAFDAAAVPYYATPLTEPSLADDLLQRLVRAHTAPVVLEIMGSARPCSPRAATPAHGAPRGPRAGLAAFEARLSAAPRTVGANGMPVVTFTHKSFASPDVARDKAYWTTAMQGREVADDDAAGAFSPRTTRRCSSFPATRPRATHASSGGLPERAHARCIASPTQGFDRLADSHAGHSFPGTDITSYTETVKNWTATHPKHPLAYRYFAHGLFDAYMPNGWGMQPGKLPTTLGGGYDFCKVGVVRTARPEELGATSRGRTTSRATEASTGELDSAPSGAREGPRRRDQQRRHLRALRGLRAVASSTTHPRAATMSDSDSDFDDAPAAADAAAAEKTAREEHLSNEPNEFDDCCDKGMAHVKAGEWVDAAVAFEKALAIDKKEEGDKEMAALIKQEKERQASRTDDDDVDEFWKDEDDDGEFSDDGSDHEHRDWFDSDFDESEEEDSGDEYDEHGEKVKKKKARAPASAARRRRWPKYSSKPEAAAPKRSRRAAAEAGAARTAAEVAALGSGDEADDDDFADAEADRAIAAAGGAEASPATAPRRRRATRSAPRAAREVDAEAAALGLATAEATTTRQTAPAEKKKKKKKDKKPKKKGDKASSVLAGIFGAKAAASICKKADKAVQRRAAEGPAESKFGGKIVRKRTVVEEKRFGGETIQIARTVRDAAGSASRARAGRHDAPRPSRPAVTTVAKSSADWDVFKEKEASRTPSTGPEGLPRQAAVLDRTTAPSSASATSATPREAGPVGGPGALAAYAPRALCHDASDAASRPARPERGPADEAVEVGRGLGA
ncbi:hypothetical protein JL721_12200 [Aureococcus anophagefferens]|nr:hypothetical protein JL721_12200 [Aureococcus anophagefferens]